MKNEIDKIDKIDDLADLESFDKRAFEADADVSQDVCNFVLTLALIFNDLKDLIYAHVSLNTQKPRGSFRISRLWGAYNGINMHLLRLMLGLFHEFIEFLKRSDKVLIDPFLQSVLKLLSKENRELWQTLVNIALDKQTITAENRFAFFVRNKLVFHYDPKEIFWGYNAFFSSNEQGAERAFVSRGMNMAKTRHFFADGAAQGYFIKNVQGKEDAEALILKTVKNLGEISLTITEIVNCFIQKRGFAYKAESEE